MTESFGQPEIEKREIIPQKLDKSDVRGHRGVGKDETNAKKIEEMPGENSLESLKRAVNLGVGIEFDVWQSNGDLKLWHDDPKKLELEDTAKFERLTRLEDVFKMVAEYQEANPDRNKVPLDIEIKDLQAAQGVLETLKNYPQLLGPQTKIISFDLTVLERIDKLRKETGIEIDTGFLYEHKPERNNPAPADPISIAKQIGAKYIIPDHKLLDLSDEELLDFVARAAKNGVELGTWTVDDLKEAERLKGAGIKSITTNEPEKFFKK